MRRAICAIAAAATALTSSHAGVAGPQGREAVSLAGGWRFEIDRSDTGLVERWHGRALAATVELPGTLPAQGIGDEITLATPWTGEIIDRSFFTSPEYAPYREPGRIKIPFWLQPDRYYVGPAWYQREIEIPESWRGRRVLLTLERPHWQTMVWLDNRSVYSNDSLSTPHEYELGVDLRPGPHVLTIRVDNRLVVDVGINSHSVSDHTQGNWNGIVGRLELASTPPVWIDDLQVYPRVGSRSVTVRGRIGNRTSRSGRGVLVLSVRAPGQHVPDPVHTAVSWNASGGVFEADLPLGPDAALWDEFAPALYRLGATLDGGDRLEVVFGLREIATRGTQFTINGRKAFFRGTLECAIFPATGHPPTEVDAWRRIIRIAKAHGLNLIRFHSWCPPEAAFVAADELGFYFQVEVASWANNSTRLGMGLPIDDWLYREADRILRAYGNHPSFVLMPFGNEPAGRSEEYLARFVAHYKARDGRRLYTSGSGWPQIAENQFHVTSDPRIQAWGAGLGSRVNARPPETRTDYRDYVGQRQVPVISHEIGQWCVYPNLEEIPKYRGYLKPRNLEIVRDSLAAHGMLGQARDFLMASGKLQALLYKEEIESALRTPGMGGFELLDLHDFPGQGTALVGVLDPFWDEKGYVTAAEYRRFAGSTVPLARLDKRVFTTDDVLVAELEVAHFGPTPLQQVVPVWRLVRDDGEVVARGELAARDIPVDNGTSLGTLRTGLARLAAPRRYRLAVGLRGTPFENDWDVWVYPSRVKAQAPPDVAVVGDLDEAAAARLEAGGRVLLLVPPDRVRGDALGKVEIGFSPIFWNTAWTKRQAPHTLGILCDPGHPALAHFPTGSHSDWQWWYLVSRAGAMILDGLPHDLRPVVQAIDDWFTNRKLGLLFEARIGRGRLVVCSIDLAGDLRGNPVARQMRHSLLQYMSGAGFEPSAEVTVDQVRRLLTASAPPLPASVAVRIP